MKLKEQFLGLKLNVKFTVVMVVVVMMPIFLITLVWNQSTKQSVIEDHISSLEYNTQRAREQMQMRFNSINMVTQFFIQDEGLISILQKAYQGEEMDAQDMFAFKNTNIVSLERLVNNNATLYGVRVYGENDNVQEMMPILYQHSRMRRQSWAAEDTGESTWSINHADHIFGNPGSSDAPALISLITPLYNSENQRIATVEAAMAMSEMFPSLYENSSNLNGYLIERGEIIHTGADGTKDLIGIVKSELAKCRGQDEVYTYYKSADSHHLVVSYVELADINCELVILKDVTNTINQLNRRQGIFYVVMMITTACMAFVIHKIVKRLLKKFYHIIAGIHRVQDGDMAIIFDDQGRDEMSELGGAINKMMLRIKTLMAENIQREMLMKDSEIKALQNQINAHFIYNVLEAIKMMAEIDERYDISDSITSLGELLRYGMKWTNRKVTVKEEIAYMENYIRLMNLRYDFEIRLSLNIAREIYSQKIPKMSLQPLVENAICHGIEELAEDATIYVKTVIKGGHYAIEITDSGKGMSAAQVELLMRRIHGQVKVDGGTGNGIGLKNVQDRIRLAFGEKYGIRIVSRKSCFTKIIVSLPFTKRQTGRLAQENEERWEEDYADVIDCGR